MKNIVSAVALAQALALAALAPATAAPKPPTAEEFARRPTVSSVNISPDGKHMAAVASPDGKTTFVQVWNLDKPDAQPTRIGAPPRSDFVSVSFLKDDRILTTVRQPYTSGTFKGYVARRFIMDLDGGNVLTTYGEKDQNSTRMPVVINRLPLDKRGVLISDQSGILKLDVYSGQRQTVQTDSEQFSEEQIDLKGEVRARQKIGFENGSAYIAQFIRHPDTGAWDEHFRWFAKNREPMSIVAFTKDPNIAFVATNRGRDKAAIFEYDIRARKLLQPAFEHKQFEADGVVQSNSPADYGEVLGFTYAGPTGNDTYWLDPQLKAAEQQAGQVLKTRNQTTNWVDIASGEKSRVSFPAGAKAVLIDWSDDRKRFLIARTGPSQPPEFYLIDNGKMRPVGRSRPWLDGSAFGETRLVQYPARDGMLIPAIVHTPSPEMHGPGPYPTIVHPHGGPWARDNLGFDGSGWTNFFVARGYAVVQPQFRGSMGWGQKLWRAGDSEWGQKMQDDKDDAARWLISQKIADPNRIAMHGFSYGGYASIVAALRPNGLYQCAMSGAGVGDLAIIRKSSLLGNNRLQREFQAPTIDGLDPLRNVNQASIPLLLYHGDYDRIVPIKHSEDLAARMRSAGKPVKLVKFDKMAHSSGENPEQQAEVLTTLENYLKNECGPGGL